MSAQFWVPGPNGSPIRQGEARKVNQPVEHVLLMGVPNSIRGPYIVDDDVEFPEGADVMLEGPFQTNASVGDMQLLPTKWTIKFTTSQTEPNGSAGNAANVHTASLVMNPYANVSGEALSHFEKAWTSMQEDAADKSRAIEAELRHIRAALSMRDPATGGGRKDFGDSDDRRGSDDEDSD